MNETIPPPGEGQKAKVAHAEALFRQRYPAFAQFLPLTVGVFDTLHTNHPEVEIGTLRQVLAKHCHQREYLQGLVKSTHRHALDGTPVAELSDTHRRMAIAALRAMETARRTRKERQRAQQKLEEEAKARKLERAAKALAPAEPPAAPKLPVQKPPEARAGVQIIVKKRRHIVKTA